MSLDTSDTLPGRVWVADRRWHPADAVRRCRYSVGPNHRGCGAPAIVTLARGRTGVLWGYCERHLYGRRWDSSSRVVYVEVAADSPAARRGYVE